MFAFSGKFQKMHLTFGQKKADGFFFAEKSRRLDSDPSRRLEAVGSSRLRAGFLRALVATLEGKWKPALRGPACGAWLRAGGPRGRAQGCKIRSGRDRIIRIIAIGILTKFCQKSSEF